MNDQDITEVYRQQHSKLLTKIERYKREIEEDEKKVKALEVLIGEENHSIVNDRFDNMNEYPFIGTYIDKIKYVLSKIGNGTARDISSEIIKIEKITDIAAVNKVSLNVTLNASRLYVENILRAEKIGNTNLYSLAE